MPALSSGRLPTQTLSCIVSLSRSRLPSSSVLGDVLYLELIWGQ